MSELVSAFPTSGGIYWWASKLGGAKAGFYTGWLNLIGLIAILASVAYGCATFLDLTLGTFSESWLAGYSLTRTFILFVVILAVSAIINIFSSHLLAVINNISVWWHVAGAATVILILFLVPEQHASFSDVFAKTINNSGMFGGSTSGFGFLFFVLPIVGDPDAVHDHRLRRLGAPVRGDQERGRRCGQGHLAVDLLLGASAAGSCCCRSCSRCRTPTRCRRAAAPWRPSSARRWTPSGSRIVLFISTAGQFFCTTACQTSASRMLFAFSRDRAVPGSPAVVVVELEEDSRQRRHDHRGARGDSSPCPPLSQVDINGAPVPVAFFAVVSIGVVGLYLCFAVPIYYRWKAGDAFPVGSWNLRGHHKWMAPVAIIEIIVTSIIAMFPTSLGGMPWDPELRVEVRQLHAAAGGRRAGAALHLLARLGEELVQRADQAGR